MRERRLRFRPLVVVGIAALFGVIAGAVMIAGGSSGDSQDVRILARQTDNGATEVALQVRNADHSWGDRILPRERFLAADSEPGR